MHKKHTKQLLYCEEGCFFCGDGGGRYDIWFLLKAVGFKLQLNLHLCLTPHNGHFSTVGTSPIGIFNPAILTKIFPSSQNPKRLSQSQSR